MEKVEKTKSVNVRFVMEIDGVRSVIDSTLPREQVKRLILEEVEELFLGNPVCYGEDRFVGGSKEWHLKGRYLT